MESESHQTTRKHKSTSASGIFLALVAVIVVGAACFYGGVSYEKNHQKTTSSTTSETNGFSGGFGRRGGFKSGDRVIGDVTAVSPSSITVKNVRTGTSSTLTITSSTQITDSGQTSAVSDIQVGNTVFISENTSNTSQASTIVVNPSFGGGPSSNASD